MAKVFKFTLLVLFVFAAVYIFPAGPGFPDPLPDSLQSREPADSETSLRRAYFTNFTREEVMAHYVKEFGWGYRLNYPPEESQKYIRDQTRSTFLEEIVHPLRESVFVNGFEPKDPKDAIEIAGKPWRQKIIVRYVPSNLLVRLLVIILSGAAAFLLLKQWPKKN